MTTPRGAGERRHRVPEPFSLAATCGPVAWGGGRWPDVAWVDDSLVWIGREGDRVVHRRVRQIDVRTLGIQGDASPAHDAAWLGSTLGVDRIPPAFQDAVLRRLAMRWPGMRPFASGSLLAGLVTSILGQSVSVSAAATTVARLAALWHGGSEVAGRRMRPLPTAAQLGAADPATIRATGTTWRRAGALVAIGAAAAQPGSLLSEAMRRPSGTEPHADLDALRAGLRRLPLVGPWTTESALLWGIGASDVHPSGDAALLRAARAAYERPDLDHPGLDALATTWRPNGGWAARLLWLSLLGPAPGPGPDPQPSAASAASR